MESSRHLDLEQLESVTKRIKLEVGSDNIRDFCINSGPRNSEGFRVQGQGTAQADAIHDPQDPLTKTEIFEDLLHCRNDELEPLNIDEVEDFIRALQEADDYQSQVNSGEEGPGVLQQKQDLGQHTSEPSQIPQQFVEPFAAASRFKDICHFNWSTFSMKPKVSSPAPTGPNKTGRKRKQPLQDNILSLPSPLTKPYVAYCRTNQTLQNTNDPAPSEVLQCPQCPRHFETTKKLKSHLKIHEKQNQGSAPKFKCSFCPKSYSTKSSLCKHQQVHTGEKPFKCPHCTKCFPTQLCVDDHIRYKHTGERPFACPTCGKRFFSYSNLWQHSRLHTGLMAYGCEKCGKRFRQSSGLSQHFRKFKGNCVSEL